MDCRRADELLIDFLYQALDERTREEFQRHLEECPAHRREVEQHGRLLRALRAEPREEPDAALDRRILEEANRARPQDAKAERQPWWALVFRPNFAAAALLLLLGVGVVVFMQRFQETAPAPGGAPSQAVVPDIPPPAPPTPARPLGERHGETPAPVTDEPDVDRVQDSAKPEDVAGFGTATREADEGAMRDEKEQPKEPALLARDDFERKARRRPAAALPPKAPRKGLAGGMHDTDRGIAPEPGATAALPQGGDAGARGAAGAAAEAKPASAPQPQPKPADDARSPASGKMMDVEEEARFAQPPPVTVGAETVKKTDAAPGKKTESRPEAARVASAPAAEPSRPAEASPAQQKERDEEQAGRARLKAAKDKADTEAEGLRRCVREESGARAADCRYRLFDALFRAGRCAEAVVAAEQAVSAAPADARAADTLLDAASCLENLGQLERARALYRRVEQEYPAQAAEARRALQRLP